MPSAESRGNGVVGVGLGLRTRHYSAIVNGVRDGAAVARVPFFEVLADNYAHGEGPPLRWLERICEDFPVVLHAVGLSLGGTDPLDLDYLGRIRELGRATSAAWISEHLAWTHVGGRHHHELLPLPRSEEALLHLVSRIRQAQDFLGRRILVENSCAYLGFEGSLLGEGEFLGALLEEADCELLLDVANLYVDARNHGFDPSTVLGALPRERVRQLHLAGHDDHGGHLVDAHASRVAAGTWALYAEALHLFPAAPVVIEWDREVPELAVLLDEREEAERLRARPRPGADVEAPSRPPDRPQQTPTCESGAAGLRALQLEMERLFIAEGESGARGVSMLGGTDRIRLGTGLAIYRGAIARARETALGEIFPVVRALVGEACFAELAMRYGRTHPSTHPDLGRIGVALPVFIDAEPALAGLPYLADVARLELAVHEAFTAPEARAPRSIQELAEAVAAEPDRWRPCPPPSAKLVVSRYPIYEIWRAHESRTSTKPSVEMPQHEGLAEGDVQIGDRPSRLLVFRRGDRQCVHRVPERLYTMLQRVLGGGSVAEVVALGASGAGTVESSEAGLRRLAECFERGWIIGVAELPRAEAIH